MMFVRCNWCEWIGEEEELKSDNYCPSCLEEGYLMDLDSNCYYTDHDLEQLWGAFGDIPINDLDEIEEPFLDFPVGTYRFDIWHWFDERYSKGVYFLAYGALP